MSLGTPQEMLDDERDYNESLKDKTPKEKARKLISKFSSKLPFYSEKDNLSKAKQCALICVDEMIKEHIHASQNYKWQDEIWEWLREVKQEINKL